MENNVFNDKLLFTLLSGPVLAEKICLYTIFFLLLVTNQRVLSTKPPQNTKHLSVYLHIFYTFVFPGGVETFTSE